MPLAAAKKGNPGAASCGSCFSGLCWNLFWGLSPLPAERGAVCDGRIAGADAEAAEAEQEPTGCQKKIEVAASAPPSLAGQRSPFSAARPPGESGDEAAETWKVPIHPDYGFRISPEIATLLVPSSQVAAFSLPKEALVYEPSPAGIVSHFANGAYERMIYWNICLDEDEARHLRGLQELSCARGLVVPPSVAAAAPRILFDTRADYEAGFRLLSELLEWRRAYFRRGGLQPADVAEDLSRGFIYFCGRDRCLRPALVVRPSRAPTSAEAGGTKALTERLIRVLVFTMEYFHRYMIVPGRVENLSVIIDLAGAGFSHFPLMSLAELVRVIGSGYPGTVSRFYILNMNFVLRGVMTAVQQLLSDRQREKVRLVSDLAEMRQEYAAHQLEEDLGGARGLARSFFPYPLPAGPFDARHRGPPDDGAVPNAHEVFGSEGPRPRLWDPTRSSEENRRPCIDPHKAELLYRCGIPAPQAATKAVEAVDRAEVADAAAARASSGLRTSSVDGMGSFVRASAAPDGAERSGNAASSSTRSSFPRSQDGMLPRVGAGLSRHAWTGSGLAEEPWTDDVDSQFQSNRGSEDPVAVQVQGPEIRSTGFFLCTCCRAES